MEPALRLGSLWHGVQFTQVGVMITCVLSLIKFVLLTDQQKGMIQTLDSSLNPT